jgi:hypothetical protein
MALQVCGCDKDQKVQSLLFLVHKGLGEMDAAEEVLFAALEQKRSFEVVLMGAQFYFDLGELDRSVALFEDAISDRQTIPLLLEYGQVLITSGSLQRAYVVLEALAQAYFSRSASALRSPEDDDLLRIAGNDVLFITVVSEGDRCISDIPRDFFPTCAELKGEIPPLNFELSEMVKEMVADADRIGARCSGPNQNGMVIRALGFCVLRLCVLLQTADPGLLWTLALENMKVILAYADFRKKLFHSHSDFATRKTAPTYHAVRGGGPTRRFAGFREYIFKDARAVFSDIQDIRDVFHKVDKDVHVFEFKFDWPIGKQFDRPAIVLSNSGVLGYDIDVRIRTEPAIWRAYDLELQDAFQSVTHPDKENPLSALAKIMLLIWLQHPLPFYSEALGHVAFHACTLVIRKAEVLGTLPDSIFIRQMVQPNLRDLLSMMPDAESLGPVLVKPASFEFWNELPSMLTLMSLLNYPAPREPE